MQAVVADDVQQHGPQFVGLRIPGEIRGAGIGAVTFNVFGADSWADKNKVVVKVAAVQNFGGHRIEKGFCQFGLVVVHQQSDEVQFDLLPHFHGLLVCFELALQTVGALFDAKVIKFNALSLGPLLAMPVSGFKAVFGPRRFGAKQAVVVVEAIHHGFGNVVSQGRVESLRKHPVSP